MGYDLRIETKKKVTEKQWKAIVDGDPGLRWSLDDYVEYRQGRTTRRAHFVYCGKGAGADVLVLAPRGVTCKHPQVKTIKKMVAIAKQLGGEVVGDDGERYDATGKAVRVQAISGTKASSKQLTAAAEALCDVLDDDARKPAMAVLAKAPAPAAAAAIFDALANVPFGSPDDYFDDAPAVVPFLRRLAPSPALTALLKKAATSDAILVAMAVERMATRR